jgi:hypothetical protein
VLGALSAILEVLEILCDSGMLLWLGVEAPVEVAFWVAQIQAAMPEFHVAMLQIQVAREALQPERLALVSGGARALLAT